MQSTVSVEIMSLADPAAPAPMRYLLDGVDAQEVLGGENVNVVVPTQVPGSWHSDWNDPDHALGVDMWETFPTTELAPILLAESELNFNGPKAWVAHDTVRNPEGLRDMAVYLSAAKGTVTDQDLPSYGEDPFFNLLAGSGLERGVLTCTQDLERAMVDRGMDHQVIHYKGDGVHNWRNFDEELAPSWETIRPALY